MFLDCLLVRSSTLGKRLNKLTKNSLGWKELARQKSLEGDLIGLGRNLDNLNI